MSVPAALLFRWNENKYYLVKEYKTQFKEGLYHLFMFSEFSGFPGIQFVFFVFLCLEGIPCKVENVLLLECVLSCSGTLFLETSFQDL